MSQILKIPVRCELVCLLEHETVPQFYCYQAGLPNKDVFPRFRNIYIIHVGEVRAIVVTERGTNNEKN